MITQVGVAADYYFQATPGVTPGILVANIPFGTGYMLAHTTAGITEVDPGQYYVTLPGVGTPGTYAIIVDDGAGNYYGEDLQVTATGLPPIPSSGAAWKLVLTTPGLTGLVGTLGLRFRDTPAATTLTARSTSGITEQAGTGVYAWSGSLPTATGTISAIWDTGGGSPSYAAEELTLAAALIATTSVLISQVWVDDTVVYDVNTPNSEVIINQETLRSLLSTAKPRDEAESRADDDGAVDVTQFYEPRVFDPFSGKIRASSYTRFLELHSQLARLFSLGSLHTLGWSLGDGSTRQCQVRAASEWACDLITPAGAPRALWSIQLVSPDALLTSANGKSTTLDPSATSTAGLSWPLSFPLDFAGTSSGTVTVGNEGTRDAKPVYTFAGPWDDPFVENATTGIRLYTTSVSLAAGEFFVIDTKTRTVSYQGAAADSLIDWERSTGGWPVLPVGDSIITAGGSPGSGALLQVDYADTYV